MKPGELEVRHEEQDGRHIMRLVGELDLASADELEHQIARFCLEGSTKIVLDLDELSFVDSSGLRTMLAGRQLCERSGGELVLVNCQERMRRVLELTGMDGVLQVREEGSAGGAESSEPDAPSHGPATATE